MKTIEDNNRKIALDIAKGIGIILVVWQHAGGPLSEYIDGFHMPLFVFVSGMLYKNNRTIKDYSSRKIKSLLIPFWTWNFIFYPLFFVLYYWKNWSLKTAVKEILEIIFTVSKVPFLGATWFLASLFWISFLVHVFCRIFNEKEKKTADIFLAVLGVGIASVGFCYTFPYRISRTLVLFLFYILGFLYQKYVQEVIPLKLALILAIISALGYYFIKSNNYVSMGANLYDNRILFIVGALLASYFVLVFSELLEIAGKKSKFLNKPIYVLAFLGQNSIDIVIWHFLAFRMAIIIQILTSGSKISLTSLTAFPTYDSSGLWWILYIVVGIIGSIICGFIIKWFLDIIKKTKSNIFKKTDKGK